MTDEDGIACCNQCRQPLIEIDHYGERLVGCIECNRWSWPGSEQLFIELPDEDLEVLERKSAPDLKAPAGEGRCAGLGMTSLQEIKAPRLSDASEGTSRSSACEAAGRMRFDEAVKRRSGKLITLRRKARVISEECR